VGGAAVGSRGDRRGPLADGGDQVGRGFDCKLIFIMGNHDQRLSTRSALLAPSWKASTARTYATAWTRIGRFAGKLSRTAPGSTRSSSVIAISRVTAPGAITSSPPAAAWSRATLII